jgi:hypothetical protein
MSYLNFCLVPALRTQLQLVTVAITFTKAKTQIPYFCSGIMFLTDRKIDLQESVSYFLIDMYMTTSIIGIHSLRCFYPPSY